MVIGLEPNTNLLTRHAPRPPLACLITTVY